MEYENKKEGENIELEVHLEGKNSKNILISLDDLQNLVIGINGLSKFLVKKKFGKESRARFGKEMKEICSLGVKDIKKGSAILELQAFPEGQQKIDPQFEVSSIMKELINLVNNFDSDPDTFPLDALPYLDSFTKPLMDKQAELEISIIYNGKKTLTSKKLNFISRGKIQNILERKRLTGGTMYGNLKEINLKNYSTKIQLFNKKLETFYFDPEKWENVRDLLQLKVEVRFEGKRDNKKLIEIKEIKSYQDKKNMTGKDLLDMGIFGVLSNRDDLKNSLEYARKLGDEAFK